MLGDHNSKGQIMFFIKRRKQDTNELLRIVGTYTEPKRHFFLGWLLVLSSRALLITAICAYMAGVLAVTATGRPFFLLLLAYPGLIFPVWMHALGPMRDLGRRFRSPPFSLISQLDPRQPILYLRSFTNEKKVSREEEALSQMLSGIGPLIAIGKPGDLAPPLGATRIYLPPR